ncbi:MAG: MBL fold metallo-hydrolase [Clostridia bacterium]|nr:MBL fold metallo-hydrolase [Clostridia bacterium]
MIVKILRVGQIGTNCYLMVDDDAKVCAVIDPGDSGAQIAHVIDGEGWTPTAIFLTHGHFDHILGVTGLQERWPELPVYCHPSDWGPNAATQEIWGMTVPTVRSFPNIKEYQEGDTIEVGNITVKVIHTPGHTQGSVTLQAEDCLFTGDTLFAGSMGRTDLAGGDFNAIMRSLARLAKLEGDYHVCPGHESQSTLDRERKSNFCVHQALDME